MSTGEGEDVLIDEHLVARKDPDREAWEITDAEGAYRGRVVETAGGFQALKPFGKLQRGDVRLARESRTGSRANSRGSPFAP